METRKFSEWAMSFKKELIEKGDPYQYQIVTLSQSEYDIITWGLQEDFFMESTIPQDHLVELLHIDRVIKYNGIVFCFRIKEIETARQNLDILIKSIDVKRLLREVNSK